MTTGANVAGRCGCSGPSLPLVPDSVLWLRRDLRRSDHPALGAAAEEATAGGRVLPLFVVDPALWQPSGVTRRAWLARSLAALSADLVGALVVRYGDPRTVVPAVVAELSGSRSGAAAHSAAPRVHVTADAGPYGRRRDEAVGQRLEEMGSALVRTGTPYAVGPGTIVKADGSPYQVFTPFARAWADHGWPAPAPAPAGIRWATTVPSEGLPAEPSAEELGDLTLPPVGEAAARARWQEFLDDGLEQYGERRDRPDLVGTSELSAYLKFGEIHPRTLLADLARRRGRGPQTYRTELAWREFYADVLWHRPGTARESHQPRFAAMSWSPPGASFDAWRTGRTGYPFVDAGMRQLLAEGWMHNRVRMVVASFLVKDLHVAWTHGARHFMHHLRDGDLASNAHGWQWAAGTGTDAAPYVRVFNPVTQGRRFDPDGAYVRRYVPELRHLAGADVHEPWAAEGGYDGGYPERIVDHATERLEALRRFEATRL
jgi:deoxyribodipyrimidine photo-lyase